MDELLQLVTRMTRGLDHDMLLQRLTGQRQDLPPKASANLDCECRRPTYVRGLEEIGKALCPQKPVSRKTLRKLIQGNNLPAVRVYGLGWVAEVGKLRAWLEAMIKGGEKGEGG